MSAAAPSNAPGNGLIRARLREPDPRTVPEVEATPWGTLAHGRARRGVMCALVVIAGLFTASTARAETPAEAKSIMKDYFDGEKTGGYVLVGLGLGGIAAGSFLLKDDCKVRQGMSYPLLAVGTLHVIAGIYIGTVSDRRIADFNREIDVDGQTWTMRERERMDGVSTQFTFLKLVEVGLVAGGAGLAYYGYKTGRPRAQGAGIGIAIEAAVTLAFDLWASRRADAYADRLDTLEIVTPRFRFAF